MKALKSCLFFLIVAGMFFSITLNVSAQEKEYIPLAPSFIQDIEPRTPISFGQYVTGIFKTGIILAVVLAVLMIVWGGFEYLSIESITGKGEAKKKWENAGWGLALVLAAFLILQTINPDLVKSPDLVLDRIGTFGTRDGRVSTGQSPDFFSESKRVLTSLLERAAEEDENARLARDRGGDEEEIQEAESRAADIRKASLKLNNIVRSEADGLKAAESGAKRLVEQIISKNRRDAMEGISGLERLGLKDDADFLRSGVLKVNARLQKASDDYRGVPRIGI